MKIGARLKELREFKKLSISDVAEKLKVTERYAYKIEARSDLNTKLIRKYCQAIGVSVGTVFRLGALTVRERKNVMGFLVGIRDARRHWSVDECSRELGVSCEVIEGYEIEFAGLCEYIDMLGGIIDIKIDSQKVLKKVEIVQGLEIDKMFGVRE